MSTEAEGYGGYTVRPKGPGSARHWVDPPPENWQRAIARAEAALAEPYRGVTTDGLVVPGLFPLEQTGVSTRPIVNAARAFMSLLDEGQRRVALHPIESPNWRKWANWEQFALRHGVSLETLTSVQRDAALDLMRESLSVRGFDTTRNVMKLNHVLGEITGNWPYFGEWVYFLCVFGEPSADEPWGWQLDGHHLNLNYFVVGDQVVMTPGFWGAEPVVADRGVYQGLREFDAEQREGLALVRGLSASQRRQAIIYDSMLTKDQPPERYTPNDGRQRSVAFKDNVVIPFEGLRAESMSKGQQKLLLDLIGVYTSHLRPGHDQEWIGQVRRHLDETWFAWIGGYGDNDTFYYKVHSPVLLVEFDMHKGVFLSNDEPEKFHVHAVVRTPNGNDYGKDLLRQHLARHHHPRQP
jgi:hypothetical protein